MANVLLLRAPSGPRKDRYEEAFSAAGYHPISVPVLETVFANLSELGQVVRNGPTAESYDGVIMTSGRAAEAWKSAVYNLASSPPSPTTPRANWSSVPFYVVGQATALTLLSILETYPETPYAPRMIKGETTGTGEKLARFIVDDSEAPRKLLYLTGDKNRDTLPKLLGERNIEARPLQVYETQGSSTFESDLASALKTSSKETDRWWIIHFAPSAARFVAPILSKHLGSSYTASGAVDAARARIASIGPVTTAFLRDELKLHVDVTAPKPTPQELVNAIVEHDK